MATCQEGEKVFVDSICFLEYKSYTQYMPSIRSFGQCLLAVVLYDMSEKVCSALFPATQALL